MKATLLMGGEARDILSYNIEAERIIKSVDLQKYINYLNGKVSHVADRSTRLYSHNDARGSLLGWIINIQVESTSNDRHLHEWLTEMDHRSGEILIPCPTDEDILRQHIHFEGAWATNVGDCFSDASAVPLTLNLRFVAPYINMNGRELKQPYYDYFYGRQPDIIPGTSPAVTESPATNEIETEVAAISFLDPLDYNPQLKTDAIRFGKTYRVKVDSYTTRERYPSETVNWRWGYIGASEEGKGTFIEVGSHKGGDVISFEVNDPELQGKELLFYAYIHSKEAGGRCRAYVDPFYYYKGVREWGKFQEDLGRHSSRMSEDELKNVLGEKKFQERAASYLYRPQAETDYRFALALVLNKKVAEEVMQNFYYGNGKKLSYGPQSKVGKQLQSHPGFQKYFQKYLNYLEDFIRERTLDKMTDDDFTEDIKWINFSNKSEILPYDLFGLMGGTQKAKIEFEVKQISLHDYEVNTRMYIKDWYGADWDDINTDWNWSNKTNVKAYKDSGLWAFFMLQHYHGCVPFETELIYESTDIIKL